MPKTYCYVVKRDYGFAPNPFHGFLTLATCKPIIRRSAHVGDFLIGISPVKLEHKLVYMAKISRIVTFDEYWTLPEFACKKVVLNGSRKLFYGDNIYHHLEDGSWKQENSHHSLEDGSINKENLVRDTGLTVNVLIADEFFYFGQEMIDISAKYPTCAVGGRNHRIIDSGVSSILWEELKNSYEAGIIGFPRQFKKIERYNGKS